MFTPVLKPLLASGIALAMVGLGGAAAAAATVSSSLTEARQETQIWTTYALNPYLRASDLAVSVHNGTATLTGKVEDDVNKDLAKQIALGVKGVTSVDNQIVVQHDYVPASRSADRGYGEVIDDATITAAVKSKLLWSKNTAGLAMDVDTNRGSVTLSGSTDSAASKELATRLARNTRGVVAVDNRLVITGSDRSAGGIVKGAARDAEHAISDGWITAKVKSTFMYSSNIDGSDIAVDTNGGIVTLSGKVDSGAERALAIELAGNVRGVKSVQSTGLVL